MADVDLTTQAYMGYMGICSHGRRWEEPCPGCDRAQADIKPSRFDTAFCAEPPPFTGLSTTMRKFETGATRNTDDGKLDFEGFYSPLVVRRFAEYMHKHRVQADGTLRDSANWQKGIPKDAYMKSGFRHFFDWWEKHRCGTTEMADLEEALCALLFNAQGYLFEILKTKKIIQRDTSQIQK